MALRLVTDNLSVLRNKQGRVAYFRCGRCRKWLEVEVFTDKAAGTTGPSVVSTMVEHTRNCEGVLERRLPLKERIGRKWFRGA
jgi:hypothetical protein